MNLIQSALFFIAVQSPVSDPQVQWMDAHRLHLRNGNFIDGIIEEMTADIIILRYTSIITLSVPVGDLKRDEQGRPVIEEIKLRHVTTEVKRVEVPKEPDPTPTPGVQPVDPGPTPTPTETPVAGPDAPPIGEAKRARIESFVAEHFDGTDDRYQSMLAEIQSYGLDGARYLTWRIRSVDEATGRWAHQVLRTLGSIPFDADIQRLLRSSRSSDRAIALLLLGERKFPEVEGDALRSLRDADVAVRIAAATALESVGTQESLEALADATLDRDSGVRQVSASAATQVARRTQGEAALAARWISAISQASDAAKPELAEAIGRLAATTGNRSPLPRAEIRDALASMLGEFQVALRIKAAVALGEGKLPEAHLPLVERLRGEDNDSVIQAICNSLTQIGNTAALEPLIEVLRGSPAAAAAAGTALRALTRQSLPDEFGPWNSWFQETFRK